MVIVSSQPKRKLFKTRIGRIRHWVGAILGTTQHEQRVMRIAVGLFDLTATRHGLQPRHRRLLMLAALLHDVGRAHGRSKHHITGSRMVQDNHTLRLRPSERLAVAYLARYHRGRMPDSHKKWRFGKLESSDTMHLLLAMLRAADTLDSRHIVTQAVAMRLKAGRLRIRCHVEDVEEAEKAFVRPKKFRPLEDALDLRIVVQLRQAEPAAAATQH